MSNNHDDELQRLRVENILLKSLLMKHGIDWPESLVTSQTAPSQKQQPHSPYSSEQKIQIFLGLFRGRTDVFPLRWESQKGKSGYSPACANEWKRDICRKPKIKCGDCEQRRLLPVTKAVIFDHLAGKRCIGVYPLLPDDTCYFLAMDFDEADWRGDVTALMQSCRDFSIPAAVEISRSGNGAHIWIFFSAPVPAVEARRLGAALISHACAHSRQLRLSSYDRFFPNQDTLPKGGFGNLIALPLQKGPRTQGKSVFVDGQFMPYPDQWSFLASMSKVSPSALTAVTLQVTGGSHPLDVAPVYDSDQDRPWELPLSGGRCIPGPLPASLQVVQADRIYIAKNNLPQPLLNRLIRLAAFQNPEFYKAQAMRLPVWNKARIIGCAENFPKYIALPRGCFEDVLQLLEGNRIVPVVQDERISGRTIAAKFLGKLKKEQKDAVKAMLEHGVGVLHAPTAFGKTVVAAAMVAKRKVSTLILVHRAELLRQWQERLQEFLFLTKGSIGIVGAGKHKPSQYIDIALLQTLTRNENIADFLSHYGLIIVDECHHISAFSFESILKQAKAKYVAGLTATPERRDGHHPIIFMQCGRIRHTALKTKGFVASFTVFPIRSEQPSLPESNIQELFSVLIGDESRNTRITNDVCTAYNENRKVLLLTERIEHLLCLHALLKENIQHLFVLHGRLSKKQRLATMKALTTLETSEPRVLLATGKLIGEGFDHSPLDTMFLAMPISWRGTLQQYAGRLHREHTGKHDVRIYDYVETGNDMLRRMWEKRLKGYASIGYVINDTNSAFEHGAGQMNLLSDNTLDGEKVICHE